MPKVTWKKAQSHTKKLSLPYAGGPKGRQKKKGKPVAKPREYQP